MDDLLAARDAAFSAVYPCLRPTRILPESRLASPGTRRSPLATRRATYLRSTGPQVGGWRLEVRYMYLRLAASSGLVGIVTVVHVH